MLTDPPYFSAQNFSNNQSCPSKRTKAPLVDSTLLRFLSSEKKKGARLGDERELVLSEIMMLDSPRETGDPKTFNNYKEGSISVDGDSSFKDSIENYSWLSQYNAQRVAMKLQGLGANHIVAIKSGAIVQDYALNRVNRHRIRKFLQERDESWESGDTCVPPLVPMGVEGTFSLTTTLGVYDIDSVISVMMEHGLTGNDVAAIFAHTPSVAMMRARPSQSGSQDGRERKTSDLEETLDRAFVGLLCGSLRLRRYDARKVLRASPGLLSSNGSFSAEQVVNLMITLGSSANSLARDKTALPSLLCRSPALMFRLVSFLSSSQLKVPLGAIGPILRHKQSTELLDAVAPAKSQFFSDYGISGSFAVGGTSYYQKIERSYQSIEDVARVLRESVGIRDFGKILSSYPAALFLNVTNIELMTTCLREDVGMTKDDIAKAIHSLPALLKQDIGKVRGVVKYLLAIEVGEEALPSILRSFPATLLLDVEVDMMPIVSFLQGIGVRNVGRFVARLPPVLGYSVENDMKPRWDFLKEVCQFNYFEVVRFPAYFSYPLERVIKVRYEYLRDVKQFPIELVRVDDVLRFGDRDFATEIALDEDNGDAFSQFVENRAGKKKDCSSDRHLE